MVIDPSDQEEIDEIDEIIEPEEVVDPEELDELTDFTMEMELDTQFEPDSQEVETPVETDVSSLTELMSDVSSPVVMKGLMVGRTAKSRAAAVKRYGSGLGKFTEPAVLKALDWLRDNQKSDGSWGKDGLTGQSNVGYTGLAILTFLAHGETPSSADYGNAVGRGIRYIIENQNPDGTYRSSGSHQAYGHAMATYALAEAYTMTENPLLAEPVKRGVEIMIRGQMDNGGYDYNYKNENRNDLSVGAWQVQSMKAASISAAGNPRLEEYKQKAMDGMLAGSARRQDGKRFFSYSVSPGQRAQGAQRIVSAAGTLCLFLTGRGSNSEAKDAIDYLETFLESPFLPEWGEKVPGTSHGGLINMWYYAVQAFFQEDPDGRNFKRYMAAMVKALVQNQADDGHWLCYSESGMKQGKTYNTTLAALGLMVFYRYLPTTQAENIQRAVPQTPSAPQESEDEVSFEI
jgi:hypothetical protein